MRRIVVLGSTGSIGRQTLDIVRAFPNDFEVVGLAGGNNTELLTEQIAEFSPRYVWCNSPPAQLPAGVAMMPMNEMAALPEVDQVMVALMGAVGLSPTLEALKAGKQVALSNKEPIVMAGEALKSAEAEHGGVILPVDSEPSAIWQCLQGEDNHIRRLMITASGGPFRRTALAELESVTPEQALRHPTWRMGDKITIDSATLMNKAFEVIESHWLFAVPWEDHCGGGASAEHNPFHGRVRRRVGESPAWAAQHEIADPIRAVLSQAVCEFRHTASRHRRSLVAGLRAIGIGAIPLLRPGGIRRQDGRHRARSTERG